MSSFFPSYFLVFEALSIVGIILILARELWQRNYGRAWEVVACAFFGMILEIGDTAFTHSYSYSNQFVMQVAGVPVAIGLGWAAIIYCAMLLSDQYNVHWTYRVCMDALTALTLDVAMDMVAIRMGFWTWSIPLDQQWYGVPYANFAGWIFVGLSFSFIARFIRTLNFKRLATKVLMLLTPILAYIGLLLQFVAFSIFSFLPYRINNWTAFIGQHHHDMQAFSSPAVTSWELILLVALIVQLANVTFFAIKASNKCPNPRLDIISFGMLSTIHLFFIFALFQTGMYRTIPIAIPISLAAFAVHCVVHFLPWILSGSPKRLYIFNALRQRAVGGSVQLQSNISAVFR